VPPSVPVWKPSRVNWTRRQRGHAVRQALASRVLYFCCAFRMVSFQGRKTGMGSIEILHARECGPISETEGEETKAIPEPSGRA
jgi:hypothetical protein